MIPEKLIIQGLYSYQEKQIIDFKPLTDAKLFGIFGHVGSGKSTILEAMIFSLYGKTDRIGGNQNRNYNMMNLRSDHLNIEFLFSIKGKPFRTKVKSRRNSKNFEDVRKYDRTAYTFEDDEWLPIEQHELEDAIGLDYDNFKRAVIIPQGKFQEFITLSVSERTKMIQELFDLEQFELSQHTSKLLNQCQADIQKINGKLEELNIPTEKEYNTLKNEIKTISSILKVLNQVIKDKSHIINDLNNLINWNEQRETLIIKQKELKELSAEINKKKEFLEHYKYCSSHFDKLISEEDRVMNEIADLTLKITENSEKQTRQQEEKITFTKHFSTLKERYDRKDILRRKEEAAKALMVIRKNKKIIHQESDKIATADNFIANLTNNIRVSTDQICKLKIEIADLKKTLPDNKMLNRADEWHNNMKNLWAGIAPYHDQVKKNREEIQDISHKIKETADSIKPGIDLKLIEPQIDEMLNKLQLEIDRYQDKKQILITNSKIREMSVSLKDGEPCPLCGALEHPGLPEKKEANNLLDDLNNKINKNQIQQDKIRTSLMKLLSMLRIHESLIRQNAESERQIAIINKNITAHKENFCFPGYETADALAKAKADFNDKSEKIDKLIEQSDILAKDKEAESSRLERAKQKLRDIEKKINDLTAQTEAHYNLHKSYFPENHKAISTEMLETHIYDLHQLTDGIENKYEESKQYLDKIDSEINTLSGIITSDNQRLDNYKAEIDKTKKILDKKIAGSSFVSVNQIREILSRRKDVEKFQSEVEKYNERVVVNSTELKGCEEKIAGRKYNREEHEVMQREYEAMLQKRDSQNRMYGEKETLFQIFDRNILQAGALGKELKTKEKRKENLELMKSLFRGSGFVNYISTVYLSQLVDHANIRFRHLTRQHLKLELSDNNEFLVRDFMNGGNLRSVKTLSGGQMFQCALSLALALSDSVQHRNKAEHNFFFLDEGFGALDKEALEVVFKTLKNLQKENRIVGIISHVDEMQQEVEINLKVINDPERGSLIINSWE